MTNDPSDTAIPNLVLPEPYAGELLAFCKKLEREIGLGNGATTLFWHLAPIAAKHLNQPAPADPRTVCAKCGVALGDAHDQAWGNGPYEIAPLI